MERSCGERHAAQVDVSQSLTWTRQPLLVCPLLETTVTAASVEVNKPAADNTVVDYKITTGETEATELSVVVGPGQTVAFDMDDAKGDYVQVTAHVVIAIPDFVTVSGDFGFAKGVVGTTSTLLVAVANISTFLGTPDESMGVRITDANFGMLLIQNPSGNKYALTAGGTAELVGFDGILELSGSLAVKVNKTGIALNETISLGATTVDVVFADGARCHGLLWRRVTPDR